MIKIDKETKKQLLEMWRTRKIGIEGNLLKVIDTDGDEEFNQYILESTERDKESRKKRLDMTKQVQSQNRDLIVWKEENEKIQKELKDSLAKTEETMLQVTHSKEEAAGGSGHVHFWAFILVRACYDSGKCVEQRFPRTWT